MFDLLKDVDKYKGIPPYATELFGVYQPLLGWQSSLTKKWIKRGGTLIDPNVKRILDGRIQPGPDSVDDRPTAQPLVIGSAKSPYTVLLTKDLSSEVLKLVRARVQNFVDDHGGLLPKGSDEWQLAINIKAITNADTGDLRVVNDIIRSRVEMDALRHSELGMLERSKLIRPNLLALMQYESQIAALLVFYAKGQGGIDPNDLTKLFLVQEAPPLSQILSSNDPLSLIDPTDVSSGALSPVGFVHLFRQYFFDLGTFLGEPVEHVWLAPGTTIELIEVSTRKVIVERSLEESVDATTRSEQSSTLKDELSDAVKQENANSTKLGVTSTNTVNLGVYQGTVSANFGVESTRKDARETAHKQTREQSEKLSTEIKRSVKSVFKTVTETTDMRSKRYVLQNSSDRLINYELRRKMRRVGVQMQDIGMRMCWQVFIDDPAATLGLSELVHFAESPDLANLKEPDKIATPGTQSVKMTVPFPFNPILGYSNNRSFYQYESPNPQPSDPPQEHPEYNGQYLGHVMGDEDDPYSQIVIARLGYKIDPPQTGYKLAEVRLVNVQGGKFATLHGDPVLHGDTFDLIMERVHFGGESVINLDLEVYFDPTPDEVKRVNSANDAAATKYDADKQRLLETSFKDSVRQRIKAANGITPRPSWDLREEERTVVYRNLIERLMLDSWDRSKLSDNEDGRRLNHLRSEVIRAIFDVDALLYFVAPEWWMPRRRPSKLNLDLQIEGARFSLTDDDLTKWGGEPRNANYKITEESAPAKLGSSLGWLLQLDGDNLRNAFLNAPWVKAVIPIRPGRETAALVWLRAIEGHETDGWDTPYLGSAPEDVEFKGMNVGDVLETIAKRLESQNGDIKNVLEADKVFQNGFDNLAGGFDAALPPNTPFTQWVSVLPTDQIVAAEYVPTDLLSA